MKRGEAQIWVSTQNQKTSLTGIFLPSLGEQDRWPERKRKDCERRIPHYDHRFEDGNRTDAVFLGEKRIIRAPR